MAVARADLVGSNFYSLHSVTGNLGDTGNYLLRFGNGKQHLGPNVVVGYGIKIFWPGLFHYVTRSPGGDGITDILADRYFN